ncbi:MAG: DNA-processing protein DprA, partial [Clostridia bacterium]|nr:DNA-processing protein DprA [Clostridia bacterium]
MTKLDYWLWLSLKEGIGQQKISHLLEQFDSPEEIFKLSKQTLKTIEGLGKEDVRALSDKNMKRAAFVKEQCKRFGIRILTYDSEFYPQKLKEIADPPHVLYVLSKTRINLNDKLCIGMVGNRVMTEYGRCVAQDIATQLSKAGVVVVSGMARGIDGTAHTATLHSGGIPVAVLGCGLDTAYPPEHDEMMEAICETGMVISEYPPGTPPAANHFPIRNRIISGLSDGIVVVEAPEKSGSLI